MHLNLNLRHQRVITRKPRPPHIKVQVGQPPDWAGLGPCSMAYLNPIGLFGLLGLPHHGMSACSPNSASLTFSYQGTTCLAGHLARSCGPSGRRHHTESSSKRAPKSCLRHVLRARRCHCAEMQRVKLAVAFFCCCDHSDARNSTFTLALRKAGAVVLRVLLSVCLLWPSAAIRCRWKAPRRRAKSRGQLCRCCARRGSERSRGITEFGRELARNGVSLGRPLDVF